MIELEEFVKKMNEAFEGYVKITGVILKSLQIGIKISVEDRCYVTLNRDGDKVGKIIFDFNGKPIEFVVVESWVGVKIETSAKAEDVFKAKYAFVYHLSDIVKQTFRILKREKKELINTLNHKLEVFTNMFSDVLVYEELKGDEDK
jgi:uncharacterized metal-binding protein